MTEPENHKRSSDTPLGMIVSHTHWDREWRMPIWGSRRRLVRMLDALLGHMEQHPEYRAFLLDGQVIALEDYIQARPENRERIRTLIRENRLHIGPWYNLPDEFPVGGESLIRNLMTGIRKAEEWGGAMRVGYTPFGWGQTAQLPQLYAGFDIDFIVLGKNVSRDRAPNSEFLWEAPDGTRVLTTRLGAGARANFYFSVVLPVLYGKGYKDATWGYEWPGQGWYIHAANTERAYAEPEQEPDFAWTDKGLSGAAKAAWATMDDSLVSHCRFLGDGVDYSGPTPHLQQFIDAINAGDHGFTVRHGSLPEYADTVRSALKGKDLKVVEGELRDGPAQAVSANALMVRPRLKSLNREAEIRLLRYAEPLIALATGQGVEVPPIFLQQAWEYLLKSHSHDAINGVTQDKTADDIAHRLNQVIELADTAFDSAAEACLRRLSVPDAQDDDFLLAVYNPLPETVTQVVEVRVDIPQDRAAQDLRVTKLDGTPLPIQQVHRETTTIPVAVQGSRAVPFRVDRHRLFFETDALPATGFQVYRVEVAKTFDRAAHFWPDIDEHESQVIGAHAMANEHLEVRLQGDGTFDLVHRASGEVYRGLNYIEESGDIGDYWQRVRPDRDRVITSVGRPAEIALVEDGPLVTTYECRQQLMIPRSSDVRTRSRSEEQVALAVTSRVTLRRGQPFVEVSTDVENAASHHRMRVAFPSGIEATHSHAQGHFGTDRRLIKRPRTTQGLRPAEMGTHPMQHWVDVSDGKRGLAVLNRNLLEYEVSDDASHTVALTLFRSVPVKICSEYRCAFTAPDQHGSQSPGKLNYSYAVMPHAGDWREADLNRRAQRWLCGPRAWQISKPARSETDMPLSLLSFESDALVCSAVKLADDASGDLIARFYNPAADTQQGTLTLSGRWTEYAPSDLGEWRKENWKSLSGSTLTFSVHQGGIQTFRFR